MPDETTLKWQSVLEILSDSTELSTGKLSIIRMTRVIDVDGTLVLVAGSPFTKSKVEEARATISRALTQVWGRKVPFEVTVDTSLDAGAPAPTMTVTRPQARPVQPRLDLSSTLAESNAPEPVVRARPPAVEPPMAPGAAGTAGRHALQSSHSTRSGAPSYVTNPAAAFARPETPQAFDKSSHLNPRYTFDNYVMGDSNRFAFAAALKVAEQPGNPDPDRSAGAYNPLFIYGGSGLGKTHLLHAIGNHARSLYQDMVIKYVSSEEFVSDFISSVAEGTMNDFKRRYRDVDILLVDDVQFLGGKEQTLEEFFHTFNTLYMANKQVVLTSDLPPKDLKGFEKRLLSRFESGLTVDVQPPTLETRTAILRNKAGAEGVDLPLPVLEYIASRVTTNIRELEGALIRVTAFASLTDQPIDQTLAEMVLKDIIASSGGGEITAALVMTQTADYFGLTIEDLRSKDRAQTMVHARHIAMYLCRELIEMSTTKIGKEFGGKDHTTVMSASRKISTQMAERRDTYNQVQEITARIKQAAQAPR